MHHEVTLHEQQGRLHSVLERGQGRLSRPRPLSQPEKVSRAPIGLLGEEMAEGCLHLIKENGWHVDTHCCVPKRIPGIHINSNY